MSLVDVIEGRGPAPALVLSLVQRLPDTSLTTALVSGGRDHFGWGHDRYLDAALYDAVNLNTKVTGSYKKGKSPDFPAWPRPEIRDTTAEPAKRTSVADIYKKFTRRT